MYLPSVAYAIILLSIFFGIEMLIYMLFVYTPSIALIQYFNKITSILGLTINWSLTLSMVLSCHVIGMLVYSLIEKKLPFGKPPRNLSLSICNLIIITIMTIIAFTNISTILTFMNDFVDKFIVKPIIDMITKFIGVGILSLYVIYIFIVPNFLRLLEAKRIPLPQSFILTFIIVSFVSIISLRVVNESLKIIESKVTGYEFSLAIVILGLIAFFEFVEFAKNLKVYEIAQMPAILQLALWIVPVMESLGFSHDIIISYTSILSLIFAIVIFMHVIFIMFGLIVRKANLIMIGQAIAVAYLWIVDINARALSSTLPSPTLTIALLSIFITMLMILKKIRIR